MKFKIIFLLIITFILLLCSCDNQGNTSSSEINRQHEFVLSISNNTLCLFDNNSIIKAYDVNLSVLPSEDILLLTNGISVENISEADSIAENFDG